MKSDLCKIEFGQTDHSAMLDEVEKAGKYAQLDTKSQLRLRLLAEELMGMMSNIAMEFEATVWVETEPDSPRTIRLCAEIMTDIIDADMRKSLLAVATTGENEAYKGFMGKIRKMVEVGILGVDVPASMYPVAMPAAYYGMETCSYYWEMNGPMGVTDYVHTEPTAQKQPTDGFEQSIVAAIADNVLVGIKGSKAEIVIVKKF